MLGVRVPAQRREGGGLANGRPKPFSAKRVNHASPKPLDAPRDGPRKSGSGVASPGPSLLARRQGTDCIISLKPIAGVPRLGTSGADGTCLLGNVERRRQMSVGTINLIILVII